MYKQNFHLRETAPKRFLCRLAAMTLFLLVLLTFIPFVPEIKLASATIDATTYDLSLTTSDTINLSIQPGINNGVAAAKDMVVATTNSPAGYKLYLSTNVDLDENIYLDGDAANNTSDKKFVSTLGTYNEPNILGENSWGYAVAGLGDFDTSYDNVVITSKFAKMPVYGSEQLIHSHTGVANEDTTEVYFGARAGINLASGSYATEILYTVMSEVSSEVQGEATISPVSLMSGYTATTATITTSLTTTRDLGNITILIGGKTCSDVVITETNPVALTCELPLGLVVDTYDVEINFTRLGKSYTIADGLDIYSLPVTITLDAKGGDITDSIIELVIGAMIGELPVPEFAGHTFDGWYTAPNGGGTKITADTIVTAEITLYANYYGTCAYSVGDVWNFNYTGGEQTFEIPAGCEGLYKLEVWGSRGGNSANGASAGGNGGYSSGYKYINDRTNMHIVCGGTPYNGGGTFSGSDGPEWSFGWPRSGSVGYGGGATHIATVSGTLASIGYNSFVTQGNGYIVAGGGGGGMYGKNDDNVTEITGGVGGGLTGGNTTGGMAGATQTSGYAFGQGATGSTNLNSPRASGGGGLYGGITDYAKGASGGSGYIGGVPEVVYKGVTYSPSTAAGTNSGNGRAKITLIDLDYPPHIATVTWNYNDGSDSPEIITTTANSDVVIETPKPTKREGFRFLGWATSPTATTPDIANSLGGTFTYGDSITYYALWQEVTCDYDEGQIWNFAYTGNIQSWTVPDGCEGFYKLEVWGAQGGNSGGYGGYATGSIQLGSDTLYLGIGGGGGVVSTRDARVAGGYNGGGVGIAYGNVHDGVDVRGSGGGATHIATVDRGVLANYGLYRSDVLIVAGGGGGSATDTADKSWVVSGTPGGGDVSGISTSFGTAASNCTIGGGGGGGWYGGNCSYSRGEGGSGYIGGVYMGSMSVGANSGNGKAKITLIEF